MKIMINTMPPYQQGGVANFYKVLRKYWNQEVIYNYVGGRRGIPGSLIIMYDVIKFIVRCLVINPDIVVLNPSLRKNALRREALFLQISKFLNKKTIVFFRGWGKDQEKIISQNPACFCKTFNRADGFLVLASDFKKKLEEWSITKPIFLTVTKVDDELVENFRIDSKQSNANILFLARVEEYKGIFVTLKAFEKIHRELPKATLTIAGEGSALDAAKAYVDNHNISNVSFKGYITGEAIAHALEHANIYILPTHGEGMPSSVLEAMAFGVPVITRPVGGLKDFFEDEKMGYLIETLEADDFARCSLKLLQDSDGWERISNYNYEYAKQNFKASKVAIQLEELFKRFMSYPKGG
jgi:glycosyltransferase involved in cell wall biosynthesis